MVHRFGNPGVPVVILLCSLLVACGGEPEWVVETPISEPSEAIADTPDPTATRTLPTPTAEATATPSPSSTPSPAPAAPTVMATELPRTPTTFAPEPTWDVGELERALDDVLRDTEGVVAVSIAAPDGTVLYQKNAGEAMEAASIYKLGIMVELYRQRDAGLLTFDDSIVLVDAYFNEGPDSFGRGDVGTAVSIDTLLFAMIAQSSNVASYALLDFLGNDPVNATMASLGVDGIQIRWRPANDSAVIYLPSAPGDDESEEPSNHRQPPPESAGPAAESSTSNVRWLTVANPGVHATTRGETALNGVNAGDLARLFVLLLNGLVVSEASSAEMLDLLGRQEISGGLGAELPQGAVAHKTGYLRDGVVNDAGIVYTRSGPIVVVVLTEGVRDDVAFDITSKIGLLVYDLGS